MKKFVVVEVGSTTTKGYVYDNGKISEIFNKVIEFKNNYKKYGKIIDSDKTTFLELINNIKEENIFVYGTSIFRNLNEEEKKEWNKYFKNNTGIDFNIVTPDMENEYTVYGVINDIDYKGKIAVMIGGGGSTEVSITENGNIIEKANNDFGAYDITLKFPDLGKDIVTTDFNLMIEETKKLINIPKNKADILVLAGGNHIYFYEELKYPIKSNNIYKSHIQPYCINKKDMEEFDKIVFYNTSLDEVCKRTDNYAWWRGARGMRVCSETFADILGAKYIIPTKINMVYGIINELKDK